MIEHLKRAWAALATKRTLIIVIIFLAAVYGFLILFNFANSEANVIKMAAAIKPDKDDTFVLGSDVAFENKILDFLKVDKLCAVTNEQAELLKQNYDFEVKEYYIAQQAKTIFVLYVKGPKASLPQLEAIAGPIAEDDCRIVHGSKVVAVATPVSI